MNNDASVAATLNQINYGLFIVSSINADKRLNGQIATVVFQVTCEPNRIATCLNKETLTHSYVKQSGVFSVSTLAQDADLKFIGHFGFKSGRDVYKFDNVRYDVLSTGAPIVLDHTVGGLDCRVDYTLDVGTHELFVGRVLDVKHINDKVPMTYDYYHRVVKGKTHKNAPTYNSCKITNETK
jgi:ferric-chelate reductase [NAD(P)H]